MAFDFGSLLGGGLSGAATGSAFGPIGAVAGGLLGGLGGAFGGGGASGGGGPSEYQMTPLQEELSDYGMQQVKASPQRKKAIRQQFKSLRQGGNRGAAEAFLESYRDRFSNPEFIEKRLAKSYGKDIDFNKNSYFNVADEIYNQAGIGFSGDEYGKFAQRAKARGIRSPQAFQDMLRQDLIASGKMLTPQQEQLSYIFGTPSRDESGRVTNLYKAIPKFDPATMPQIKPRNDNNEYTFNINYKQTV